MLVLGKLLDAYQLNDPVRKCLSFDHPCQTIVFFYLAGVFNKPGKVLSPALYYGKKLAKKHGCFF